MKKHKKIWVGVLWVLLPFVVASILLFALPFDKRFGYVFVKDNCSGQSVLLHDRLFYNDKPIDIAFFGTSHMKDAVNDYRLEEELNNRGVGVHVMNMGYCRMGRNMPYHLLKEMLKTKKPRCIVLEIAEKENRDGHMDFAYMADAEDVLAPVLIFNDNIFQDFFKALVVRFEAFKQKLLKQYKEPAKRTEDYGHGTDWTIANANEMQQHKDSKMKNYKRTTGFARWFYNKYSFNYIDKTIALAEKHDVQVLFLYLPEYASLDMPEEIEFYKQHSSVLIPPDSIYQNTVNWKDVRHMNTTGADALTPWLADELEVIIKQ